MNTWNYRVLRKLCDPDVDGQQEEEYAIYEVYYDTHGNPAMCSEDPVFPMGNTQKELMEDVQNYLKSFDLPCMDWHAFKI
jgi:hypothetical protein